MKPGRAVRFGRWAYLVLLVVGASLLWWNHREAVRALLAGARPSLLGLSLLCSFGLLALSALFWWQSLRSLGERASFATTLTATLRSVPARYVPGSVWFAVGRAVLLTKDGVRSSALAATATLEMIFSLATTLGVGGLLLGFRGALPGGVAWVVPAVVILLLIASPPAMGKVVGWLSARRGLAPPVLTWSSYARLGAIMLAFWSWSALTFSIFLSALPGTGEFGWVTVAGAFLFSWGIGFLAVFAPQGLGVFELTLAAILADQEVGAVAVVLGGYRVLVLGRDALASVAGELRAGRPVGRVHSRARHQS